MSYPPVSPLQTTDKITSLLTRLHAQSSTQESGISSSEIGEIRRQAATDPKQGYLALDALMLDKFIALDQDKCLFMYNLLLSLGATTVVEAGTSFGVSTIYLALAVARNVEARQARGDPNVTGRVIGTEKEDSKAAIARRYWAEAGPEVEKFIDLKVGDLNETLAGDLGLCDGQKIDFLLLDIWPHVALPALNHILPRLRPGAVVLTDNTISSVDRYGDLLKVLRNPDGPFRSVTLPYSGGFEFSVYNP